MIDNILEHIDNSEGNNYEIEKVRTMRSGKCMQISYVLQAMRILDSVRDLIKILNRLIVYAISTNTSCYFLNLTTKNRYEIISFIFRV